MATYNGQISSYDNTEAHKTMVTDRILNTNPLKIIPYMRLGADISGFNFVDVPGQTYKWLEDTYVEETCTVTGLTTGTTTTTFTPSSLYIMQPGDLWEVDSEIVWVNAVSSGIPTVTRGYMGTTAATHVSGSTALRVGIARIDGDDADDSPQTSISSNTNYTQILQRTIEVTRTKQKLAQYGISDAMGYEIDKKMDDLMMDLCKMPYYGGALVGSAAAARTAGGFKSFITTNSTNVSSAALTRDHIDDLLQDIHSAGGDPDLILCGSFAQRKINSFYEGFIQTERSEMLGGNKITQLQNPISGSILDVLPDLHCPADELWILESEQIAYFPFDPFFYEELSKTGDATKGQVVGEYGFVCQADKHHGYLYGISTSS